MDLSKYESQNKRPNLRISKVAYAVRAAIQWRFMRGQRATERNE